jgi:hypothetical protein
MSNAMNYEHFPDELATLQRLPLLFIDIPFIRARDPTQGVIFGIQFPHNAFVFFFEIKGSCGYRLLVQHLVFWNKQLRRGRKEQ